MSNSKRKQCENNGVLDGVGDETNDQNAKLARIQPVIDIEETEEAIKFIKDKFQQTLARKLNLLRVSAPLFVKNRLGLQDDLSGVERPICFDMRSGEEAVINHSLAKWKRMALGKYNLKRYKGLYTDMNAIRRDEEVSPIHSYYVDQWDWEMVIQRHERTEKKLEEVVEKLYEVFKETEAAVSEKYPTFTKKLPEKITFMTTQDLEDKYPDLTPNEREYQAVKKHGAVFLKQIGKRLKSGQIHDKRAPDYDDWELNGDILFYFAVLDRCLELSSMGIRVDEVSMDKQLKESGCDSRRQFEYHQRVLNSEYPLTIGGGIGQSRICMFFLEKRHIGEVQVSLWPDEIRKECLKNNIFLL